MPTLDEAPRLPRLLQDLTALTVSHEIIVADGDSADGTRAVAAARGCRIVASSRGRGSQLRAGVAAASGEWILVL
ncbi:MAG: glycosyltransferase, partial [Gammaproteobacteria bacterium]